MRFSSFFVFFSLDFASVLFDVYCKLISHFLLFYNQLSILVPSTISFQIPPPTQPFSQLLFFDSSLISKPLMKDPQLYFNWLLTSILYLKQTTNHVPRPENKLFCALLINYWFIHCAKLNWHAFLSFFAPKPCVAACCTLVGNCHRVLGKPWLVIAPNHASSQPSSA